MSNSDERLHAIRLKTLLEYAEGNGWHKVSAYGANADVYSKEGEFEVLMPRRETLDDYPRAVSEILRVFALEAEEDEHVIQFDPEYIDRDVFRVRVADSAINAKQRMDLHRGAYQLWEAGVASVLNKTSAKEYWNRAHLPLPEYGSYIITMLSPIVSSEGQIGFDGMHETRRVSIRLEEAFKALRVCSTKAQNGDDTAFDNATDKGITSDLCKGLAQTVKPFERLDISFSLAVTVLQRRRRYGLQFKQQDYSVLQEASKQLKGANKVEPTEQQIVSGYVTACKRPQDKDDGNIVLSVLRPDGKIHTINLDVKEAEYRLAVDAHKNKSRVEAQGTLIGTGRKLHWKLNDPKLQVVK